MDAIIAIGADAKEIAALIQEVQGRQRIVDENEYGTRLVTAYKNGRVILREAEH